MFLVMAGPPGAGKGTQSRRLEKKLGIPHLSTGNIFREIIRGERNSPLSKKVNEYVQKGDLVPDKYVIKLVKKELNKEKHKYGAIIDGFPRTLNQAKALKDFLEKRGKSIDLVIKLKISKKIASKRLLKRGRNDDVKEKIETRFDEYIKKTKPVFSFYKKKGKLANIDAEKSREAVFHSILSVLRDRNVLDDKTV